MSEPLEDTGPSEAMKVFEWRLLCLLDACYSVEPARTLAASKHDLRPMERARLAGCDDELAVSIFT